MPGRMSLVDDRPRPRRDWFLNKLETRRRFSRRNRRGIAAAARGVGRGVGWSWRYLSSIWDMLVMEVLGLTGIGLVSYGSWLIYRPSGFITGGAVLLAIVAIGTARRK